MRLLGSHCTSTVMNNGRSVGERSWGPCWSLRDTVSCYSTRNTVPNAYRKDCFTLWWFVCSVNTKKGRPRRRRRSFVCLCVEKKGRSLVSSSSFILFPRLCATRDPRPDDIAYVFRRTPGFFFFSSFSLSFVRERVGSFGRAIQAVFIFMYPYSRSS